MSDAIIKIYASQDWVENAIANIPEVDMSEYATETYVDDAISELSSQNVPLTTAQINALDGMFKVCAFTKADVSAEYNAFKTAFGISDSGGEEEPDEPVTPEKTLTGISATYSGGDVAVGTAVSALTGIVVTAHYSDGTSQTVTGYTLSGTIAESSNTVTVTYQGKTATFTVTGVAESGGEETGVSNETTWTSGVAYAFEPIGGSYPDKNTGVITDYSNWYRSPYLYCAGASTLRGVVVEQSGALTGTNDNAFYDADKNYVAPVETFTFKSLNNAEVGTYHDIPIPENAAYFIVSGGNLVFGKENPPIQYVPYE